MILTDRPAVETVQTRERVLVESRGGGWFLVAEVLYDEENEENVEAFSLTGYYHGKPRAGQVRAHLERSGRWLAESSQERMRRGEVLRVGDLRWGT